MTYRPVPPQVDLPALEREVLSFWQERQIFEKSVALNAGAETWTFYEGPPTANGRPGTHHIESRTFKDVFPRFRTMQGYQVNRKGGWDCHGLPVELAVEKELGFSGKADIEAFGIAEFNARCRESVQRYVDLWEQMTDRMGCWIDMRDPYRTMDAEYVESVWWALKQIHGKGLLQEDFRVAPYCPRCGTGLSDHELAQGYETVTDPSVYVRLPAHLRPVRRPGRPARLDDDALDPGVQRPGGRPPRDDLRDREQRRGDPGRGRVARRARRSARAGQSATASRAPTWSAGPTSARSSWSSGRRGPMTVTCPTRTSWSTRTT